MVTQTKLHHLMIFLIWLIQVVVVVVVLTYMLPFTIVVHY